MTDDRITIRGLDPKLYQWLRVEAVRRKMTVGALLNEIIQAAKSPLK